MPLFIGYRNTVFSKSYPRKGSGGGWRVGEHRRGPVLVMGLGNARALQVECPAAERLPTVWSGHAPALEGCGGMPEASLS